MHSTVPRLRPLDGRAEFLVSGFRWWRAASNDVDGGGAGGGGGGCEFLEPLTLLKFPPLCFLASELPLRRCLR